MIILRSTLYIPLFLAWTLAVALLGLPFLVSRRGALAVTRFWARGVATLARWLVGVKLEVRGRENVPDGPCIIAAQHQSAFETYMLFLLFEYPVFILKDSLQWIPLVGWFIKRGGLIPINRGSGANAMRRILRGANEAISQGETLLIFPEGTRTPPGGHQDYKPGIAALYSHCNAPIIPMALNSGCIWWKTRLEKLPGTIVFEFLPAIPTGLTREAFLTELRCAIETASAALPLPESFATADASQPR